MLLGQLGAGRSTISGTSFGRLRLLKCSRFFHIQRFRVFIAFLADHRATICAILETCSLRLARINTSTSVAKAAVTACINCAGRMRIAGRGPCNATNHFTIKSHLVFLLAYVKKLMYNIFRANGK